MPARRSRRVTLRAFSSFRRRLLRNDRRRVVSARFSTGETVLSVLFCGHNVKKTTAVFNRIPLARGTMLRIVVIRYFDLQTVLAMDKRFDRITENYLKRAITHSDCLDR